jgi:hypothetical protein
MLTSKCLLRSVQGMNKKINTMQQIYKVLARVSLEGETAPFWKAHEAAVEKKSFKEVKLRIRNLRKCISAMEDELAILSKLPSCEIEMITGAEVRKRKLARIIQTDGCVYLWNGKYWMAEREAKKSDYACIPVLRGTPI